MTLGFITQGFGFRAMKAISTCVEFRCQGAPALCRDESSCVALPTILTHRKRADRKSGSGPRGAAVVTPTFFEGATRVSEILDPAS